MHTAKILQLPRTNLAEGGFDPNLARRFRGDEMREVWERIDSLAVTEVRALVLKHEPQLQQELTPEELDLRVAEIAGFFLRESAKSVHTRAYSVLARARDTLKPGR